MPLPCLVESVEVPVALVPGVRAHLLKAQDVAKPVENACADLAKVTAPQKTGFGIEVVRDLSVVSAESPGWLVIFCGNTKRMIITTKLRSRGLGNKSADVGVLSDTQITIECEGPVVVLISGQ